MNKYLIITIAALIIFGLGGVLIWKFGEAKDEAGYNRAIAESNAAASHAANQSSRNLERVINDTHHMSQNDINADLLDLGVMRNAEDR